MGDNADFLGKHGINRENLLAAIEALNGFEHSPVQIKVEGKSDFDLVACFMAIMHAIPADYGKETPTAAVTFYNEGLPEALFNPESEINDVVENKVMAQMQEEAANAESGSEDAPETSGDESGTTHECPVFGKQNLDEPDCKDCKDQFPDEFAACTVETAAAGAAEKGKKGKKGPKTKKTKEPKPPKEKKVKEPKPPKEKVITKRSRYGHILGSMSGDIDECVFIGGHIDQITSFIAGKHGKELSAARAKIRGHITHLIQVKGVPVLETEGMLKAQVEFAKDRDANNTGYPDPAIVLPEYVPPVKTAEEPAAEAAEAGASDPAEKAAE